MYYCNLNKLKCSTEKLNFSLFYVFVICVQETTLYGCTVKIHEPVGVIGISCPDKYPLLGFISLLAPAVVRGNVIVIIPSEKYPLLALDLYQVRLF